MNTPPPVTMAGKEGEREEGGGREGGGRREEGGRKGEQKGIGENEDEEKTKRNEVFRG